MSEPLTDVQIDGECERCGFPGIIGMTCSECGGTIISLEPKAVAKPATDAYDDDDLLNDEGTISLEGLAEDEAQADDETDETL